ncbi:TPA: DUF6575 domain-containing protein, partial [Salmonella enterica subsp. enterica serovar Havana]
GSTFFVYWVGDEEAFENWYVIPCSKSKIIAFEKKQLNLKTILEQQEQEYFYDVKLPFSSSEELIVDFKHRNKIAEIELPKENVFVKNIKIYAPSILENDLIPTHELIVSKTNKKSKKNVLLEHMSLVCDRFSELVFGFNKSHDIVSSLQPLNARYGSFAISLHAENLTKFEEFLAKVSELMIHKKDITSFLEEWDIDIKVFLNLLKAIENSSIDFELRSSAEPEKIIKIYKIDAEIYLSRLKKRALTYISSIKVPQGNDIEKVFKLIDLKWNNEPVNAVSLNVEPRLVAYYRQSAHILGFVEYNGELTPQGQRIALSDNNTKYRITANAFEASECVWAWINHFDLTNIAEIDPNTAKDFLTERCPTLSGQTISRRANTLSSWWKQLIPHYLDVKAVNDEKHQKNGV